MMPPAALPRQLTKPRLLIGEGQDEVFFFEALLAHLGIGDVQVEQYGGKGKLSHYLGDFLLRPGRNMVVSLGVTRDADNDVAQAFQSVTGMLAACGLPQPGAPGQIAAGPPRLGVYLLPDNARAGMLEDLCLDAAQPDGAMPCVDAYFHCVQQQSGRQPNNLSKARVHAWLASQIEPDKRLGEAAKSGYWPWNSPAFVSLTKFLTNL
jgi:hypothetical protein